MKVIRAEKAGFCMGVVLALRKLDSLLERQESFSGPLFTLGAIIHNPQVVERYAHRGVRVAETPEDIPAGGVAVIRAHGIPREVKERLRRRRILVAEATCPKIRTAQRLIRKQARRGDFLLLFGEEDHPEVQGLLSYALAGARPFASREDLLHFPFRQGCRYCLAAQTTQNRAAFEEVAKELGARGDCSFVVLQTICDATRQRQEEAIRIAREVDWMVVAGGFSSGNTRRLVQVVAAQNTPVIQVETVRELPLDELRKVTRIGLTAGASTPREVIDEIDLCLRSLH